MSHETHQSLEKDGYRAQLARYTDSRVLLRTKRTLRVSMCPLHPHEPPNTGTAPPSRHPMKGASGQ
ncbi:hypothetical protein ACFUTY_38650 [Streptomyces sp. NPDC057362]|uniref:hypothetical protein n=1 Tax=Streptomyces sp. NPDC057362 TaxID=3346106 RepID=UPI00362E14A3